MTRLPFRIAAAAGLATLAAGISLGVSAAPDVSGHVYVDDNTAGLNTVAGFVRHSDGSLTPIAGSPFAAGGRGTGALIGSQGALQLSGDGRYIVAADAGSSQVSVLRILPDGSLTPTDQGAVWSGGVEPVSIAVHGSLVYVANEGNGSTGSDYAGFRINRGGILTPIAGSTFNLPGTANPGDILFNSTGTSLIGVEVGTSDPSTFKIDSFIVGSDGSITPAAGSPFPAQGPGPFGSEFSPANPAHLYVSNAHGGGGNGTVSAFDVNSAGVLSSIGASPYADLQTAPCWVEISHDGKYLFTVNTGSTTLSSYSIQSDGSLSLIGSTAFKSGTGIRPFDARLDPSGSWLYVVDGQLDALSGFAVSGGSLTELQSSPFSLPTGATPFGIVTN